MPFCPDCGAKLSEDYQFCPECGHQLSIGQDAQGGGKKRLAETVAKQLRQVYCARCGSLLQVRKLQQNGFDEDTGYPKYDVILACPHATVFETDVSREVRFTWKNPLDRHSVRRVSMVVELNSEIADTH
ncbi:MAG: zinc-ribbon domain-containing protein [Dehalococcoidia bacterium]|nr:zinc-ribbon domain-containing protein [Dehalococcoidia bacterium]MDH4367126.1 zinc-ribbon domain-containing protein [Dehalococcoidia bacterium]